MRILIADDHDLLRDTLVMYLQGEAGFEVRTAGTLHEAVVRMTTEEPFDLVLLDLKMPGMQGLQGLKQALALSDNQRVALISGQATQAIVQEALLAGAAGFVPKSMPAKSLINAVRFMANGEQFVPIEYITGSQPEPDHPLAEQLTQRELQMLKGLTEGKSNKEIGRDLDIQEPTVKLHMKTLYRKLGASNRTQAAMMARESGLY
ncbi:MAG: response regulator transcription factor [Pseudomonadota bacterium]